MIPLGFGLEVVGLVVEVVAAAAAAVVVAVVLCEGRGVVVVKDFLLPLELPPTPFGDSMLSLVPTGTFVSTIVEPFPMIPLLAPADIANLSSSAASLSFLAFSLSLTIPPQAPNPLIFPRAGVSLGPVTPFLGRFGAVLDGVVVLTVTDVVGIEIEVEFDGPAIGD